MGKSKLDELREHYDTADMSESIARATRDNRTIDPDEVLVSTSIRLPNSLMKRVRERADAAGIPVTTLMRQWITDRLDMTNDAVVPVSEIERLIAERSRPAA
jgi:predicted DNA binding CopG/RHH family protein